MIATVELPEQDTDEMRYQIDRTRTAMADKLEALEDRVMGTVHSAQETVEDSIQTAKDTVATVKRNFDIKYQIEQHPWTVVGGCFLAGLALGGLFLSARRRARQDPDRVAGNETHQAGSPQMSPDRRGNSRLGNAVPPPRPNSLNADQPGFFGHFQDEFDKAKGMAIGYLTGLARDSLRDAMPQLASQIDEVMNSVTAKLGSKPVQQRSTNL